MVQHQSGTGLCTILALACLLLVNGALFMDVISVDQPTQLLAGAGFPRFGTLRAFIFTRKSSIVAI
jgi:hypothetical protein